MLVVFGSIQIDLMMDVKAFPDFGNVSLTPKYDWLPSGKGANQAIAAARMETKTAIVGMIGDDGFGSRMVKAFKHSGVMTSGLGRSDTLPTGVAMIASNPEGKKKTIQAAGANEEVSIDQMPKDIMGEGNVVLLQMEIPSEVNDAVIHTAAQTGGMVILNLAPAFQIPHDVLVDVDVLIVNRIEGERMAAMLNLDIDKNSKILAQSLAREGDLTCIMTLSEDGAVAAKPDGTGWVCEAYRDIDVVDTIGAGDAYCGVLASALHDGLSWPLALKRASIAASLTCRALGAQTAMPHKDEVLELMDQLPNPVPF